MSLPNVLYCNNTSADFGPWHKEIAASLKATGTMPEELADLFVAVRSPVDNPDGSPCFMINTIEDA